MNVSRIFIEFIVNEEAHLQPGKQRDYDLVWPHFHNHEHDPKGLTHCTGPISNPYSIVAVGNKHKIDLPVAKGHGRNKETQWFMFTKKLGDGWDLASGYKIIPEEAKKLLSKFKSLINKVRGKLKNDSIS